MIKTQVIDIFEAPVNAIAHQCNCYHVMGGGIAREIKDRYPEAYDADLSTEIGPKKLGSFSAAVAGDNKLILNCYTQNNYGAGCHTNYDSVRECFLDIKSKLPTEHSYTLGIPYGYGCGLAGGDWNIVSQIIYDVFGDAKFNVLICKLPELCPHRPDQYLIEETLLSKKHFYL